MFIYKNKRAISFEKLFTNMLTIFTGLSENGEILNNSQKICLLFQKVQNPILTEIKASLQVSYDMDQENTVTYDFIFNSLTVEATSLGDHSPEELHMSTLVARKHHRVATREQVAQYSPSFTQLFQAIIQRETIYLQ